MGLLTGALLSACSAEQRTTGPEQPQTPPNGPRDVRIAYFENNAFQLSQGGRYFTWYGCGGCHASGAPGYRGLDDHVWRRGGNFDNVYIAIANGHANIGPPYSAHIPPVQLWEIAAYVRSLSSLPKDKRRRQDIDMAGEPQGSRWAGPIQ